MPQITRKSKKIMIKVCIYRWYNIDNLVGENLKGIREGGLLE